MANIIGIEVSGDTYDLEDTQARQDIQTNSQDIDGIEGKIPSSASTSNKLATQADVPDISVGASYTDTIQGMQLEIYKSGKTCQFTCRGVYTGSTSRTVGLQFTVPTAYRPIASVQGVFAVNTNDVPYGQWVFTDQGNMVLYGGNGDIQTDGNYAACGVYLTA